jgi:hypothetical protein
MLKACVNHVQSMFRRIFGGRPGHIHRMVKGSVGHVPGSFGIPPAVINVCLNHVRVMLEACVKHVEGTTNACLDMFWARTRHV